MVGALTVMAQEVKPGKTEVVDLGKDVKLEMVLIPAGKFIMGSPPSEKGHVLNDETQHEVTLTKDFYIGKYEVTQEQWEAVMGKNPNEIKGAKLPIAGVSWDDCQGFIKKLNVNTKSEYRLPTEAEWEYACRGGTTTTVSFGPNKSSKEANFIGSGKDPKIRKLVAVGSYKPNAFGLHDMHGNVQEWCEDWKADYPAGAVTDPKGPAMGNRHVLRGGSWISNPYFIRSSARFSIFPERYFANGFRLAKTK